MVKFFKDLYIAFNEEMSVKNKVISFASWHSFKEVPLIFKSLTLPVCLSMMETISAISRNKSAPIGHLCLIPLCTLK